MISKSSPKLIQKLDQKRVIPLSEKDVLQMGGLGGLSTPRQAPIRAGDRKGDCLKPQEELLSAI